jgi:hypothetical protein
MTSSFPSFASFPEPEEDAPKRSQDKKQRRRREEKGRDKGRENKKRSRSRSSSRERSSKRDKGRERHDTKRRRGRVDNERGRWRPEVDDDERDKEHQDRRCLLAEGREPPESNPGTHLWFSDFKGDSLNITYGKLYKGDVPKFRRAEREFFFRQSFFS